MQTEPRGSTPRQAAPRMASESFYVNLGKSLEFTLPVLHGIGSSEIWCVKAIDTFPCHAS